MNEYLSNKQIGLLKRAIDEADRWLGSMLPDTPEWDDHVARFKKTRKAFEIVKRMNRQAQTLTARE